MAKPGEAVLRHGVDGEPGNEGRGTGNGRDALQRVRQLRACVCEYRVPRLRRKAVRLRAVAAREVGGLHPEAIPVEPLEGRLVHPLQELCRDRAVRVAVAADGERRGVLDAAP